MDNLEFADDETAFKDKVGEPIRIGDTVQIRNSDGETAIYVIAVRDDELAICAHGTQDDMTSAGVRLTQPIAGQLIVVAHAE